MGSNLKKIRSLNLNTKILLVGMLFPLGFFGTFLLNNFLKETYSSRKLELEESIENLLDKNVDLGDYVGIRFLGLEILSRHNLPNQHFYLKDSQYFLLILIS